MNTIILTISMANIKLVVPEGTSDFVKEKIQNFQDYWNDIPNKLKKVMESPEVLTGVQKRKKDEKAIYVWCEKFYSDFKTGPQIIEFTNVSDKLEHPILINLSYAIMAKEIDTMSVEQFRVKYNIENDFETDEIDQLDNEEKIFNTARE